MTTDSAPERLYYLDAVRVLSVIVLVVFHGGLVFAPFFEFVISNETRSLDLAIVTVALIHPWEMPLLFFIAGMAATFSLAKRTLGQYIRERIRRLLVPFLFGIVLLVPPQVYADLVSHGTFEGDLLTFYRFYFSEGLALGYFTWHHLWFVLYLFVLSLVAAPLLIRLRSGRLGASLAQRPGAILLGALPLALTEIVFRGRWPGYYNLYSDWANVTLFLLLFVYGYIAASDRRILAAMYSMWKPSLAAALGITCVFLAILKITGQRPALSYDDPVYYLYTPVMALNTWCWIAGLIGFAHRAFDQLSPGWEYAATLSYPFYILHQTVLVLIGVYVVTLPLGILAKYGLIVIATCLATALAAEILCSTGAGCLILGCKRPVDPRVFKTQKSPRRMTLAIWRLLQHEAQPAAGRRDTSPPPAP